MFVFEKVRSKRFPWAWSFVQAFQAVFLVLGLPLNCVVDRTFGSRSSIYLSVSFIFVGCFFMFLIDFFKKKGRFRRSKHRKVIKTADLHSSNGIEEDNENNEYEDPEVNDVIGEEYERRNSLPDVDDDFLPPLTLMTQQRSVTYGDLVDGNNPKMTCISEVSFRSLVACSPKSGVSKAKDQRWFSGTPETQRNNFLKKPEFCYLTENLGWF